MQPLTSVVKAYNMVRQEEKQREKKACYEKLQLQQQFLPTQTITDHTTTTITTKDPLTDQITVKENPLHKLRGEVLSEKGSFMEISTTKDEGVTSQAAQPNTMKYTQPNTPSDAHMIARMDQLQNQLNQVLLMMQNNHKGPHQGVLCSLSLGIPKFIASLISTLKSLWIIDSGATDHIFTQLM
ncbi:hypothetical protein Tco_1168797 [Tanacetum coccineum]